MAKKVYQQPTLHIVKIQYGCHLLAGSGTGYHTDDPQNPGGAMSREYDSFDWDE